MPLHASERVIIIRYGLRPPPGQKTGNMEESCFLGCFLIDFQSILSVIGRSRAANGHSLHWLAAIGPPSRSRPCVLALRLESRHYCPLFTVLFSPSSFYLSFSLSPSLFQRGFGALQCWNTKILLQ